MPINTVEFDLSMVSPETGEYLTARTYTVDGVLGVDNQPRQLSIGQLVMAICLQRATALEASIIEIMETMNKTTAQLESLTEINQAIVDYFASNSPNHAYKIAKTSNTDDFTEPVVQSGYYAGQTYKNALIDMGVATNDTYYIRDDAILSSADILATDVEDKMDEKNSFSQQTMIELQSQTSKRDQTYDMISNVLKSLNTVLVGISNNI